jgi:hypothetical protein
MMVCLRNSAEMASMMFVSDILIEISVSGAAFNASTIILTSFMSGSTAAGFTIAFNSDQKLDGLCFFVVSAMKARISAVRMALIAESSVFLDSNAVAIDRSIEDLTSSSIAPELTALTKIFAKNSLLKAVLVSV